VVKSNSSQGHIDKLQYAFTGPWRISAILKGASYELIHCDNPSKKEKKHASALSPYPTKLIPFQPVDGVNTQYRQIYKPISAHPFKEAGLKGFSPNQPFKVAANLTQTDKCAAFDWPSLSELNDEIAPFPWASDEEYKRYMSGDSVSTLPVLTTGPPPAAPNHPIPSIPAIHLLTATIIKSTD
jgi:hypothetical protein